MKKDLAARLYFSRNDIFADLFNYKLYQGRKVILPEDLQELDPSEILGPESNWPKGKERRKDISKLWKRKTKRKNVIFGMEIESVIDYSMPVRNFVIDAMRCNALMESLEREHRKKKDLKGSYEILSGIKKEDRITDLYTMVLHLSAEKWDAAKKIREILETNDAEIEEGFPSYGLNLMDLNEIEDFSKYHTSLKEVLCYIKYSNEEEKLKELVKQDKAFEHLSKDAADVINAYTGGKLVIKERRKGEGINMCKAHEDMIQREVRKVRKEDLKKIEEGIEKGREEGRKEGIEKGIEKGNGIFVSLCRDLGLTLQMTISKFAEMHQLSENDAKLLVEKYW